MEQREVTDGEGTTWACVQAYAARGGKKAEEATRLVENDQQEVPVVCTPRGGAQTIRLKLPKNWMEKLSDDELLQRISEHQSREEKS